MKFKINNKGQNQEKLAEENFPKIPKVSQPLAPLLSKNVQKEIDAVLAGKKPLASILELYYKPK